MFISGELYEIGYIFLYIAFFGISDYIVSLLRLKGAFYILYYLVILWIGYSLVRYHKQRMLLHKIQQK